MVAKMPRMLALILHILYLLVVKAAEAFSSSDLKNFSLFSNKANTYIIAQTPYFVNGIYHFGI